MKKLISALALILSIGAAHAQPVGQLPAGSFWGNPTAARAPARGATITEMIDRAACAADGSGLLRQSGIWACLGSTGTGTFVRSTSPSIVTPTMSTTAFNSPQPFYMIGDVDTAKWSVTLGGFGLGFMSDTATTTITTGCSTSVTFGGRTYRTKTCMTPAGQVNAQTFNAQATTAATSTSTGSGIFAGGLGVGGDIWSANAFVTGSSVFGVGGSGGFIYGRNNANTANIPMMAFNTTDNIAYLFSRGAGINFQSFANTTIASLTDAGTFTANTVLSNSDFVANAAGAFGWFSRGKLRSPANGVINLFNDAENDFGRLNFGGATSSFPSLKRSTNTLQVRLADDSAYGGFVTGNFQSTGNVIGALNMAGSTSGVTTLQPAAVAGTTNFRLPPTNGTNTYVLQTDGAGNTSWVPSAGGGTVTSVAAGTGMSFSTITTTGSVAIDKASVADFYAGTSNKVLTTDTVYTAEVTTTFGATTTFNFNNFINTAVTLTGNITTQTLSNVKAGEAGTITFIQDGTGNRTTVWNSIFKFPGGVTPTLSTAAGAIDVLAYHCRTATFCAANLMKDVK